MTILFREVAVDEGMCRAEVTLYHPLTEQFDGLSQSEGSRNYQKKRHDVDCLLVIWQANGSQRTLREQAIAYRKDIEFSPCSEPAYVP